MQVRRTALMLVAYRSHPDETKAMRNAFKVYDVDLNGRVSREEFQNVLKKQGYTNAEVRLFFCCTGGGQEAGLHELGGKFCFAAQLVAQNRVN